MIFKIIKLHYLQIQSSVKMQKYIFVYNICSALYTQIVEQDNIPLQYLAIYTHIYVTCISLSNIYAIYTHIYVTCIQINTYKYIHDMHIYNHYHIYTQIYINVCNIENQLYMCKLSKPNKSHGIQEALIIYKAHIVFNMKDFLVFFLIYYRKFSCTMYGTFFYLIF